MFRRPTKESFRGGVVADVEPVGKMISIIHLTPLPGQSMHSSEVPVGVVVDPSLTGQLVDIKTTISGRSSKVISHIIESSGTTIEGQMSLDVFRSIVFQYRNNK